MTPTQREAALRLADWLHASGVVNSEVKETIALLRELLAEPRGEPVAWQLLGSDSFLSAAAKMHHGARAAAYDVPLYTHPPLQRKPLTEDQIVMMWGHRSDGPDTSEIVSFARAIERHCGIEEAAFALLKDALPSVDA